MSGETFSELDYKKLSLLQTSLTPFNPFIIRFKPLFEMVYKLGGVSCLEQDVKLIKEKRSIIGIDKYYCYTLGDV